MSLDKSNVKIEEFKEDEKYQSIKIKGMKIKFLKTPLKASIGKKLKYGTTDQYEGEQVMISLDDESKEILDKVQSYCKKVIEAQDDLPKKYKKMELEKLYKTNDTARSKISPIQGEYGSTLFVNLTKYSKAKGDKFGEAKMILDVGGILFLKEHNKSKVQLYVKEILIKNTGSEIEDW